MIKTKSIENFIIICDMMGRSQYINLKSYWNNQYYHPNQVSQDLLYISKNQEKYYDIALISQPQ